MSCWLDSKRRLYPAVFSNPFDSFHNTVADAKEEREQLDQLLTISTPHERLLVGVIALIVAVLAAWLFLGSVSHSRAVDGVVAEPASGDGLQLLVWAGHDNTMPAEPGLPATVRLITDDGMARQTLKGQIVSISTVPPADDLAVPVTLYLVDIEFDQDLAATIPAGTRCRIDMELARRTPFSLLGRGLS